jgi:hypothetical protein
MRPWRGLLTAGLLVAAGCQTGSPGRPIDPATIVTDPAGAIVVSSSDGVVTMRVPQGALPEGVAADDLAVEPVPVADETAETERLPFMQYRFAPEGVRLSAPATVEVLLTAELLADGLMAFHVDEDGIEPLLVDLAAEDVPVATFEVDHFSWFSFHSNTYFAARIDEPARRAFTIGENVPFAARITWVDHGHSEVTFIVPTPDGRSEFRWMGTGPAEQGFEVEPGTVTAQRGFVGPTVQPLPSATVKATTEWKGSTTFVCASDGMDSFELLAPVRFRIAVGGAALADPVVLDVWGWSKATSQGFRCGRFTNLHLGARLHAPGEFPMPAGHRTDACPGFATSYRQDLKLTVGGELPASEGIAARDAVLSDADGSHPVAGVVSYDDAEQAWVFRAQEDGTEYDLLLTGGTGRLRFTTPDGEVCTYTMTFDPGIFAGN